MIHSDRTYACAAIAASPRNDVAIASFSRLRWGVHVLFAVALVAVAVWASLATWATALVVLSTVLALVAAHWRTPRISHLNQPELNAPWRQGWLLEKRVNQHTQYWQGDLLHVYDAGWVVVLTFAITEPQPLAHSLYLPIWRDQISAIDWQRLKVLARL